MSYNYLIVLKYLDLFDYFFFPPGQREWESGLDGK